MTRRFLQLSFIHPCPRRVLETGAGTGVVTRELARILPSEVAITATDLNEPMLALARANINEERIRWKQADALDLPFPNCEFDVVVCQFSVMFFPDKLKGFSRLRAECLELVSRLIKQEPE